VTFDWAQMKQARDNHTRGLSSLFSLLLPTFAEFTSFFLLFSFHHIPRPSFFRSYFLLLPSHSISEINEGFQAWGSARDPVPNFSHVTGFARFIDNHTVEVLQSAPSSSSSPPRTLLATAPHILIATGGFPTPCTLPGGDVAISSDGFFDLQCACPSALIGMRPTR
jgi:hypothetical protein